MTGEEEHIVEGATHQASTVEMMDPAWEYDVAVIDEAQMMQEEERGGSWTAAIMGVLAREVHVCAAPYAEQLLIRLIEYCGDTWEVVRHERMTPLIVETDRIFQEERTGSRFRTAGQRHSLQYYLRGPAL